MMPNAAHSGKSNLQPNFEDQLHNVIDNCKDVISANRTLLSNDETKTKPKDENIAKSDIEQLSLEQIASDMTAILGELKSHVEKITAKNQIDFNLEELINKSDNTKSPNINSQNLNISKNANNNNLTSKGNDVKNKSAPVPQPSKNISNNPVPKGNTNSPNRQLIQNSTAKAPTNSDKTRGSGSTSSRLNNKPPTPPKRDPNVSTRSARMFKQSVPQTDMIKSYEVDHYQKIKDEVNRAIREKKTFSIRGNFPAIRRALLQRGWVEKLHSSQRDKISEDLKKFQNHGISELLILLRDRNITDTCKMLIKSKLLTNHQVDLYWGINYDSFKENPDNEKFTLINRFRREISSYASKEGLCESSKVAYWYQIPGVSCINHPRSYSLTKNGDTSTFTKDFSLTAAMSLLKWVVRNSVTAEIKLISPTGKTPIKVFHFAIIECHKFIKKCKHEDIDKEIEEATEHEWNDFLEHYYKTVHIGNHFKHDGVTTETMLVNSATFTLKKLKVCWPYLDMDGEMNIWILKPTNSSQGMGIHICRTLAYILKVVQANPNRRYIIQKYIERPLLIHNTKFDIRQWFLISSSVPLTIWMYKDCYVRFSSQTYNLRKLHESIHLTNNAVQCKYKSNDNRDIALPPYNMWDSTEFKNYLSNIGYPKMFDEMIYPGMKMCIIAAVLIHQDKLDKRKNCFELYGADFMVTEDFKPWLLEINSSPALHASTPVTSKMCPNVLEDVIKVVVDYARNNTAPTGRFELIYKQKQTNMLPSQAQNFELAGKPVAQDYFYNPPNMETSPFSNEESVLSAICELNELDQTKICLKQVSESMKTTLENLLELVKKEKQRRQQMKSQCTETFMQVKEVGKCRPSLHNAPLPEVKKVDAEVLWKSTVKTKTNSTLVENGSCNHGAGTSTLTRNQQKDAKPYHASGSHASTNAANRSLIASISSNYHSSDNSENNFDTQVDTVSYILEKYSSLQSSKSEIFIDDAKNLQMLNKGYMEKGLSETLLNDKNFKHISTALFPVDNKQKKSLIKKFLGLTSKIVDKKDTNVK